jgi:hypothetical protein
MERVLEQQREEHISTADLANTGQVQKTGDVQAENGMGPLLPQDFVQELRSRWDVIQTGFVDEPRVAVQQADELVAQAIKRLAENFASARNQLEQQWDRGDNVSTEDLRVALRKYRTFFHRLLAV